MRSKLNIWYADRKRFCLKGTAFVLGQKRFSKHFCPKNHFALGTQSTI
jgi:hypothetical protein